MVVLTFVPHAAHALMPSPVRQRHLLEGIAKDVCLS